MAALLRFSWTKAVKFFLYFLFLTCMIQVAFEGFAGMAIWLIFSCQVLHLLLLYGLYDWAAFEQSARLP